jgi:hypothetical protein
VRLWTLHPKYLDPTGLVAVWREALLAQAVLAGRTKGYRHHPQLTRFKEQPAPAASVAAYLRGIYNESLSRGYNFDEGKIRPPEAHSTIDVAMGQVQFEWDHLLAKLARRSPDVLESHRKVAVPDPHPLFRIVPGPIAEWEKPIRQ